MNKYDRVIERVFLNNYKPGDIRVAFNREELVDACNELNFERIKNIGDITYTYRFRSELPQSLTDKLNDGSDWIIIGTGVGNYEFRQAQPGNINPSENRQRIKILDATPEIVKYYATGTDKQALLTKVRYNRLIDIFTGLTCYSLQNHLRTNISNVGQIEIDEVYLGVNKRGAHFAIPCQAKSPGDRLGIVKVMQDIEFCRNRYPNVLCKPIALQFLTQNDVAILELSVDEEEDIFRLSVVDEKHYKLVATNGITESEIKKICDRE